MLAYLAVQNSGPVSRDTLADLLWSDRGAEQARHSLRQMMLVLRRDAAVAPALAQKERTITLLPERFSTDLDRFRALARRDSRCALAEAGELYTAPLLDGFPPVSPAFDDWLTGARQRETDRALDVYDRLTDACTADGDHDAAVSAAERLVALDPLREDSHRRLMTAYARAGRRTDALRQYTACVETLKRELDIAPAPETIDLLRRIREGSVAAVRRIAPATPVAHDGPPWIAVLPFHANGPDPVPTYYANGLVEDMVCMLATMREPVVISSNSTLAYRDQVVDPRQVGIELGVRYVVSGSIRRSGPSLRFLAELAETDTRRVLWARAYDSVNGAPFDAQDRIVAQIITSLVPALYGRELERARAKPPTSLTAYDLVLQARDLLFRLERHAFDQAGQLLLQAIARDSGYAVANAMLADWYSLRICQGWSADPAADTVAADLASRQAIAGDGANARALALLGHNRTILHRDYAAALDLHDRSHEVAPNDASTWLWSSPTFAYVGDGDTAVQRAERALALSPRDPFLFRPQHILSIAHYTSGSYEAAAHWGQASDAGNPHYTSNLRTTAAALAALGRVSEARVFAERAIKAQPKFRVANVPERHPYLDIERRRRYADHLLKAGLPF